MCEKHRTFARLYIKQQPMKTDTKAVIYACVAVLSWSTVATAFKTTLRYLSHFEMLVVASLTSLFIFSVLLTVQRKWLLVRCLDKRQWLYFAGLGLLNPVAYYLVLFKAYALLPAQVAQPINYAWPIVLLVLLAVVAGQPIPRRKYVGMAVSLAGVALISLGPGGSSGLSVSAEGILLAALSAVLWASYWMLNNRYKEEFDSSLTCFMSFFFGTLYLLIGSCFVEVKIDTLPGLLSGMYVGGFEMGIPFICFGLAMRIGSNPALVNQLCYLSPFLSLFLIALVLGEQIATTTYVGLLLIVLGIVYNQYFVKTRS